MANSDQTRKRRRLIRGLALIVALGAIGHIYQWYWPRLHSAPPRTSSQVAGLVLADTSLGLRFWMPFPHQNLGALDKSVDALSSLSSTLEVLLDLAPLDPPSFGPFRVPPAKEMAIAIDPAGTSFVAAARVYPVAAMVFRAAGLLANNPWLAGGELQVGGRRVRVDWDGTLWTVVTDDLQIEPVEAGLEADPCLALLRLERGLGPVPEGLFRLVSSENRWTLTSVLQGASSSVPITESVLAPGVALSWSTITKTSSRAEVDSLLAFADSESLAGGLPPFVAVQTVGAEERALPGEKVLAAIGIQVFTSSFEDWIVRGYDEISVHQGLSALTRIDDLTGSVASGDTVTVGFVDLGKTREALLEVGRVLGKIPVIGENEARRWLAIADLLAGLQEDWKMSIRLTDPGGLQIEIWSEEVN